MNLQPCKTCFSNSVQTDGTCSACYPAEQREIAERISAIKEARKQANNWWYREVPSLYRSTALSKLPDRASLRAIVRWWRSQNHSAPRWLFCYGTTGIGKTRSLFLLMKAIVREMEPDELPVIIQGGEFRNEVVARTRPRDKGEPSPGSIEKYMGRLCDCEVLWLDEVDKLKFSERVEDEFFRLVDYRHKHRKLTIFAGPLSPAQFKTKMSPDDGPQIIRRIVQSSAIVRFGSNAKPVLRPAKLAKAAEKAQQLENA